MTSPFDSAFDDLREGERFRTGGRTITETDLVAFAALTGDRHPQHTDAAWAAGSMFGERIAHGLLVLSYAAGLVPFSPQRVIALRRVRDVTFKRPARIGDTLHVEGEIASTRPLDDAQGLVTCRWRILDQRGRLLATASVEAIWRREGAEPAVPPERLMAEPLLI